MAFVINPDGTISPVDVVYDSTGGIKPKRIVDGFGTSHNSVGSKAYSKGASSTPVKKKKGKKKLNVLSGAVSYIKEKVGKISSKKDEPVANNASVAIQPTRTVKKKIFQSKQEIDEYFVQRRKLRQVVHNEIRDFVLRTLSNDLSNYFTECFNKHNDYCQNMGWGRIGNEGQEEKDNKRTSIAGVRRIRKGEQGKSKSGFSRHPVYGYARDRFGRVQERDSFNEDRRNEFKQAQRRQSYYDYSSFDGDSDHDNYYDSNNYD